MQTIVVDDHGRSWDARSPTLRRFLRCPLPDFDFLTYLVDNLGFVAVTKTSPHGVRIQMRPETASQTSLAAALYCIADMELKYITITHSGETHVHRLFHSVAQAVAYMAEQIAGNYQHAPLTLVSRERPIDLLVVDYAMPEMTGPAVIDRAQTYQPELKALLITGYAEALRTGGISAIPLLAKPFKVAELGRRIAEILHDSSSDDSATGGNAMH